MYLPFVLTDLLATLCAPAWAVNKCTGADGLVMFQDLPCSGSGASKTIKIWSKQVPEEHGDRVQRMKTQCEMLLRQLPAWKDKDSLKFDGFFRGKATTLAVDGQSVMVVEYLTRVNAKNSYGAYVGEKPAICYANIGETRILDIQTF